MRTVLRAPIGAQRQCTDCNEELQRSPSAPVSRGCDVSSTVSAGTAAGGMPMPSGLRHFFEPRFGEDLSTVRLHTDRGAAASAQALNARAYTLGRDIVFGADEYKPDTITGRRLLAHELTHVLQQGRAGPAAQRVVRRDDKGPVFPKAGVKIVGRHADKVVSILAACTGLDLKLDADKMLTVTSAKPKKGAGISATAQAQVLSMITKPPHGVIIDTDSDDPIVGQFSHAFPGFQQLDIGDVTGLSGARGEKGGASACDLVVHEISEAFIGRGIKLEGKVKDKDKAIYEKAHAEALKLEAKVRKELGLLPRSTANSFEFLGKTGDDTIWLDTSVYTDGKTTRTQLNVWIGKLGPIKQGSAEVKTFNLFTSAVLKGEVKFSSTEEALKTFNKYASELGVKPIPVPEKK